MTHLSHEDLVRWRDTGEAADRARVTGHLARCSDCRETYAALVRLRPAAGPPFRFEPAQFVERGYAAFAPAAAPGAGVWRWRPAFAVAGLAAAALLVVAIALPRLRPALLPGDAAIPEVRGTDVQLLSPVGRVDEVSEFRWTSPARAASFRLEVFDGDARVYSAVVGATRADVDPTLRDRLRPGGRYGWQVYALDERGEVLLSSPRRTFILQP